MKKDKTNRNNNDKQVVEKQPKEEMSKFEKIFVYSVVSLAVILLIIVIIANIGTGGDKNVLARKYPSLNSDNVFEIIDMKELKTKINNKEKFQVLFINKGQHDADYYIYCVDDIAKTLKGENEEETTIYVLDSSYLKDEDKSYLRIDLDLEKVIYEEPSLIMFNYDNNVSDKINHSVDRNSTDRYDVEKYNGNYWSLLVKYFRDCTDMNTNQEN